MQAYRRNTSETVAHRWQHHCRCFMESLTSSGEVNFCHKVQNALLIIFAKFQNGIGHVCHARHFEGLQGFSCLNRLLREAIWQLMRVHCNAEVVSGFTCNFFLSTHVGNEYILSWVFPLVSVKVIVYCLFYISGAYTNTMTSALKLFGPRLTCRKAVRVSNSVWK